MTSYWETYSYRGFAWQPGTMKHLPIKKIIWQKILNCIVIKKIKQRENPPHVHSSVFLEWHHSEDQFSAHIWSVSLGQPRPQGGRSHVPKRAKSARFLKIFTACTRVFHAEGPGDEVEPGAKGKGLVTNIRFASCFLSQVENKCTRSCDTDYFAKMERA